MKLSRRILSLALSLAVMVAAVPFSAFAAHTCTPNTDAGGSVIWYVDATNHFNKCEDCTADINMAPHSNDGNDVCSGCGVTLDAGTNTHTHVTNGTYGHKDPLGHTLVCADTKCVGLFETHTNMVVGDLNGDGTWDCDYCGWDGVIYGGGGGGGSSGSQPHFDWNFSNGGFSVPVNGTFTIDVIDGNRPAGSTVDVLLGEVDPNGAFVPYAAADQHGIAVAYDSNGVPVSVTFDGAVIAANNPLAIAYGYFHVAVVVKDSTGTILALEGCDVDLSGGQSCNHTPIIVNGVYHYATEDCNNHRYICASCQQPYNPQAHVDTDGDSLCDVCGVAVDSSNVHNHVLPTSWNTDSMYHWHHCTDSACNYIQDYGMHGDDPNNADGLCDTCGYGSGGGQSCTHQNSFKWYRTEEVQHQLCCGDCGQDVDPAANHTDADNNGECDVCLVGIDTSLRHTHVWTTQWFANNDNTEHFNNCTDNDCTMSTNPHTAVDGDSDGVCDNCNLSVGGQSCTHNGGRFNGTDKTGHQEYCGDCGQPVGAIIPFTDADGDGMCDCCGVPVTTENGALVHNHTSKPNNWFGGTSEHFYQCDSCGGTAFNFDPHADSDADGRCDVCLVKLDNNGEHYCNSADLAWVCEDELQHKRICTDCRRIYEQAQHEDTDNNDKCDKCDATLDADDMHVHQPNGNWTDMSSTEHTCECTECEGWVNRPHCDNDADDFCDDCNRDLKCHHTGYLWYSTSEETHQLCCGDCGQDVDPAANHTDADNNGKCDVCKVEVIDNIHTHVWDTNWDPNGWQAHFHNCTDINCTTSTYSISHADYDGDGACDECGNTNLAEWCQSHIHNGDYIEVGDKHYEICGNCGNGFGFAANHNENGDYISEGTVHYSECSDCGAIFNPQPHTCTGHYDTDDGYHRAICDFCEEIYGDSEEHYGANGFDFDQWTHAPICAECGIPYGYEDHIDVDMDGICDVCPGTVTHNISSDFIPVDGGHANYCHDCGNTDMSTLVPHIDADGDMYCDVCYVDVDENAVHHHTVDGWTADVSEHYTRCINCGYQDNTTVEPHADGDADGRCDVCDATVNADGEHHHKEKYEYSNNTAHIAFCSDCGEVFYGESHSDSDDNSVCDLCNEKFVKLDISVAPSDAQLVSDIEAALEKAANQNDFTALKALANEDDNQLLDLADAYRHAASEGITPTVSTYIYYELATKSEIDEDIDLITMTDGAAALVENSEVNMAYAVELYAVVDFVDFIHEFKMDASGTEMVLGINAEDVAADRTWYVVAISDADGEYAVNAKSAKGDSSVTFETGDVRDIYVLLYVDETEEPEVTPTPEATPAPETTPAPEASATPSAGTQSTTPAPSATPETTPEASTEPEATETPAPEMPQAADTTIADVQATEEVVQAAKDSVTVSEGTATVDKAAVEAVVDATAEGETVVLPLTETTEEVVNKAEISTEALTAVAEDEKDVVIQLTDATVKLDAKSLAAVAQQAEGETIEIRVVKAEESTLTAEQQKTLAEKDTAVVVSAQIFSDGKYIGDFKGGEVTIMLPLELEEGRSAEDYSVYYIDEKGNLEKVPAEYVDGNMVFTTSHFSEYVIVYEGVQGGETVIPETPAQTSAASLPIIPIIVVIAIIIVAAVIAVKKKEEE